MRIEPDVLRMSDAYGLESLPLGRERRALGVVPICPVQKRSRLNIAQAVAAADCSLNVTGLGIISAWLTLLNFTEQDTVIDNEVLACPCDRALQHRHSRAAPIAPFFIRSYIM